MSGRQAGRLALALWAAIGAACGVIDADERLTDAQGAVADIALASSDLKIAAAADRPDSSYRAGEPIALSAQVNRPAYVAVLQVMPNGATTLVFPNSGQPNAKLAADQPLRLVVPAAAPGPMLFEFIAAERGDGWLFGRKPEGAAPFSELGATTHSLAKHIVASLKGGRAQPTAAAHLVIPVRGG